MKYPISKEKCAGCSCCQLITNTFCNVSRLDPSDYYYGCAAGVEDDCRGTDEDADQHHPGRYSNPNTPIPDDLLRHALMWMEGMPEYEEHCRTIRDELAARGADHELVGSSAFPNIE